MVFFILGIVVGAVTTHLLLRRNSSPQVLNNLNKQRRLRKEKAKSEILAILSTKDRITNNDVETHLGVSDRTASRYLRELENEGKIVQHGKTKAAYYTKK